MPHGREGLSDPMGEDEGKGKSDEWSERLKGTRGARGALWDRNDDERGRFKDGWEMFWSLRERNWLSIGERDSREL